MRKGNNPLSSLKQGWGASLTMSLHHSKQDLVAVPHNSHCPSISCQPEANGNNSLIGAVCLPTFPKFNIFIYCRTIKFHIDKTGCCHAKLLTIKIKCDSKQIACLKYSNNYILFNLRCQNEVPKSEPYLSLGEYAAGKDSIVI